MTVAPAAMFPVSGRPSASVSAPAPSESHVPFATRLSVARTAPVEERSSTVTLYWARTMMSVRSKRSVPLPVFCTVKV
ncbi:MAG: hypothetical protein DMF50_01745 [Acidobacteria bacterium]|nr:MAG: hypothetical protein DMF50_01745 [Acidobacteriota bacterium]